VQTLLVVVLSYLVGSVPTGAIAGRLKGVDLRQHGSGNLGFTNALRVLGPAAGVPVLVIDIVKGVAAVLLIASMPGADSLLGETGIRLLAGVSAVAGHVWPVFAGFKGGKGVATACGVFLAMAPVATAAAIVVWGVIVLSMRYVSAGSIVAAATLPCAVAIRQRVTGEREPLLIAAAIVIAVVVIVRHRGNIKRLLNGTENRLGRSPEEE